MAQEIMKTASLEQKKVFNLPKGATIISKEVSIRVEEIENGFLLRKSYDIKWRHPSSEIGEEGRTEYDYFTKVWYSRENPIVYKEPKEATLAEKLT